MKRNRHAGDGGSIVVLAVLIALARTMPELLIVFVVLAMLGRR